VITATEMLDSMTDEPLPSRAEVTDVANAVFDGTDALMLSEETAIGSYPIEAVRIMSEIAETANTEGAEETRREQRSLHQRMGAGDDDRVAWAVAHAAAEAADDVNAAAILSVTRSGSTPRRVAAYRPSVPIGGVSGFIDCLGALALSWGVEPLRIGDQSEATTIKEEIDRAVSIAVQADFVKPGDLVVVVAGSPGPRAGATDFLRVIRA
jgi:pyruvate kinase